MTSGCREGSEGRALHLVDLENLLGVHREDEVAVEALCHYLTLAKWREGDQVIVAAHPEIIRQIGFDPPTPCNLHATCGDDAADKMLLAYGDSEFVARRYRRLVIGSGDGIFVDRARAVRDLGIEVLVVARSDGVALRFERWRLPVVPFDSGLMPQGGSAAVAA